MKHITWTYPIVAQTPKEDFILLGKDAGEGEIISVKGNSKIHVLKSIWRENIHVHGRGFPLPELACLFAKKSIYSPHNDTIGARYLTRIVRRLVFNRYDKIITQTEYGKGQLIEAGIKPEKITLIPSVVDYSYFSKPKGGNEFRKRYGLGKEPFVLVVGIRSVKNPLVIANACERSGVKVVMIGPYEKSDLEATWKAKGFE
ncbi:MAG: glycosyltransferase, partial [Nanoarchaeota archaeon]|nr:glycosyltransferase [Nanoarchaeota archaeon]